MREAAASIVHGSLESDTPSKEELSFLSKEKIPGFTIFKRNISDDFRSLPQKLIHPIFQTQTEKLPLLVAIDQEGGRVSRLTAPFPNENSALRAFQQLEVDAQVEALCDYGKRVGQGLLELSINVDFAPVVDILTNPLNIGIGDRAFGTNVKDVSVRAGAFLSGLQATGVIGCLKHFPGQGSELSDPHNESVIIELDSDTLFERELAPYRALLQSAHMIMVSHCTYPSLDSKPASLSSKIISELLKDQMRFTGLVVSDDMNMKAISQDPQLWRSAIIETVVAGSDIILVCSKLENWKRAIEALETEGKRSPAFAQKLNDAAKKVRSFRQNKLRQF